MLDVSRYAYYVVSDNTVMMENYTSGSPSSLTSNIYPLTSPSKEELDEQRTDYNNTRRKD